MRVGGLTGVLLETTPGRVSETMHKEGVIPPLAKDAPSEDVVARRGEDGVRSLSISPQTEDVVGVGVRVG